MKLTIGNESYDSDRNMPSPRGEISKFEVEFSDDELKYLIESVKKNPNKFPAVIRVTGHTIKSLYIYE